MEQLNYQAQQFEGIVPVLDVGDPSESLAAAYQYSGADQSAILNRMKEDQAIQSRNLDQKIQGFEDIMKFSATAVKEVSKMKNQQTKDEASAVWAEAYNNYEAPSQKELADSYTKLQKEAVDASTDVETTLSKNLNNKEEVTVQDSDRAAKLRKRTGLMGVVAANARAEAAMESYGPALQTWMAKANAKKAEQGGGMIEPGDEYNRVKGEFDRLWADKTGMAMANPGYTAKNVYPRLRREAASQLDTYTRGFNIQEAAITTEGNLQKLVDGEMGLNEFFIAQKGLVGRDGKTLRNNGDVYSTLSQANLPNKVLSDLAKEINPVTKKPYGDHPRFKTLQIDARNRRKQEYTLGRAEQSRTSLEGFNGVDNAADAAAVRDQQLQANIPADIVNANYSAAMGRTDRKIEVQQETARINNLLDRMGPDYKLTAADMDGVPNELYNTFAGRLSPNVNAEQTEEMIKKSETYKSVQKDLDGIIARINPNIKAANMLTGTSGASNLNLFKQDAMNEIATRAQFLMLSGDATLTTEEAIRQATNTWTDEQMALEAKGEFFDAGKNQFKQSATEQHFGLQQAAEMQARAIKNTTITDLSTGLYESDYLAPAVNSRYSERVVQLGRQFGKTPSEIIAMARQQKGLPPLEPNNTDMALAEMNPSQRARMASLGDATPIQMAIRGQITSGQELQGSAKQRTISIGQQLIAMGYGGIWQHPDFHYDTGYGKGTGKADEGGHAPNSYHNYNEALDIGVQANGPQRLEQLYQYLLKNKERFGIAELFYDPDGSRGHMEGHANHVHVSFGGGDEGKL